MNTSYKDSYKAYRKKCYSTFRLYDINPSNGFLPSQSPLKALPEPFKVWDDLADGFSMLLNSGQFRRIADKLPIIDSSSLESKGELERAMLILSCFAHGYIWQDYIGVDSLPAGIAVPWVAIADRLGRPPIVTHASMVLNNWQKIHADEAPSPENLGTIMQFHGGQDESWFYMLTAAMEFLGGDLVQYVLGAQFFAKNKDERILFNALDEIQRLIKDLRALMARMPEKCDPYIFYHRVRPFLSSFTNITYQKVAKNRVRSYHGGSAAQSSLIQILDAVLGVIHQDAHTKGFLNTMRDYMPPKHALFIRKLEKDSKVKEVCLESQKLTDQYKECLEELAGFRTDHLRIVSQYILSQTKKVGPGSTGTGGTNPMIFLKKAQQDTLDLI